MSYEPKPLSGAQIEAARGLRRAELNEESPRTKPSYIGAPAVFALELACQHLDAAFDSYGIYLVGSALDKQDWRDVDLRMIMKDEDFAALFPAVTLKPKMAAEWEFDPRWCVMTIAISQWLSKESGLPVDFQFQPQTFANEHHKKPRNAMGIRLAPKEQP